MGGNLSVEEIEQFVALDEKQLKRVVTSVGHVEQIIKLLLSDKSSDRSTDLLKILNFAGYKIEQPCEEGGWTFEKNNKFVKKIYKFCVETNQERHIATILKTQIFAGWFLKVCYETENTFSEKVFDISNLRQFKFDFFENKFFWSFNSKIIEKIVKVFDDNFDVEIAKKIITILHTYIVQKNSSCTYSYMNSFKPLLKSEKNIRIMTGLDPTWFAKFVDLEFYDEIVTLLHEHPDILGKHRSPYGDVNWKGYLRAGDFCRKFGGSSFTKITVKVRNALQALGVVGKTELLRSLVWSKKHTFHLTFDQELLLIERLLMEGIFVPFMLHQFVKKKLYNLIRLYLDYGGDISGRDNSGKYAHEYADGKMSEQLYLRLVPQQKCASFIDETSDATSAGCVTFYSEDD